VAWGTEPISIRRALTDEGSLDRVIAFQVRLPRVLLGAIAGGGLATVGVAFQAILRNPLAEPYVLGVSGGAALGATLAILAGASVATMVGASIVPLAALAGGLLATALVYALARLGGASGGTSILLAGVVVNAIASAAITFMKTLVSASKAQELLFWLMGFLDVPSPASLVSALVYVTIGATGLSGFVGLIVPHALRRTMGPDVRGLVPASLLGGGAALVACDLVSRAMFRWLHTEPPVGAVTALIGGPVFLVLLRRRASM
jgi:iron complex transport system permease protein